jgi:hypothetical protein
MAVKSDIGTLKLLDPIPLDSLNAYSLARFNKAKNIVIGRKFNRLSPIEVYPVRDNWGVVFMAKCNCDCGNTTITRVWSLKNKKTQSCGCFNADKQRLLGNTAAMNAVYSSRRADAKRRYLTFSLTKDEFKAMASQLCFYCDAEPANEYGSNMYSENFIYQGIDRIDNSKGYVYSNCRPCCKYCNMAKSNQTEEEFLNRIKRIYKKSVEDV